VYRDKVWVERGMAWDSMQLFSLTSRTNLARNTTRRETFQAFFSHYTASFVIIALFSTAHDG
jgi:hypothetical protein